ncbi:MAG: hypothetical protein O3B31_13610 [Chloroflexi bacterium]|nr:hypothetical protein [Chloroflexota bacterium]
MTARVASAGVGRGLLGRRRDSYAQATPADAAAAHGLVAPGERFALTGDIAGYSDVGVMVRDRAGRPLDIALAGALVRGVPADDLDAALSIGDRVRIEGIRTAHGLEAHLVVMLPASAGVPEHTATSGGVLATAH